MDQIVEITFLAILYLVALIAYVFLITGVVPRLCLRLTYDTADMLGRGIRRVVYPEGRAVVYEPHPSIRKYINKYMLFTLNGYKYLQAKTGEGVSSYTASAVLYDNRKRVLDVIDISETVGTSRSNAARLHPRTSYVAYILTSVNGREIEAPDYIRIRLVSTPLYLIVTAILTFMEFSHLIYTANAISDLIDGTVLLDLEYSFFILPSLGVAVLCLLTTLAARRRKGVSVVLK